MDQVKYEYKLSDAVNLFMQQTTVKLNLWAMYVASTFAAAGFSISSSITYKVGFLVLIGYWTFTLAHFYLLIRNAVILNNLKQEIKSFIVNIPRENALSFKYSLISLTNMASSPWIIVCIHLPIDVCVTGVLWLRLH